VNNKYRIFLFLLPLLLSGCWQKNIKRDTFKVKRVISGNSLELVNGYVVDLVGVQDNVSCKDFLLKRIESSNRIKFKFDSKSPFKRIRKSVSDKRFKAYITNDGQCLNSEMIKRKLSSVVISYNLSDSLDVYLSYNSKTKNIVPNLPRESRRSSSGACQGHLTALQEACDFESSVTRNYSAKLASQSPGAFNIGQVCDIYKEVQPNWKYVNDPRSNEFFAKASSTISEMNLTGDCDDFAVVLYSLITAIGGKARINFAYSKYGGHAFTEVDISEMPDSKLLRTVQRKFGDYSIPDLKCRKDARGQWLNLDWWVKHPGGKYYEYERIKEFYVLEGKCSD